MMNRTGILAIIIVIAAIGGLVYLLNARSSDNQISILQSPTPSPASASGTSDEDTRFSSKPAIRTSTMGNMKIEILKEGSGTAAKGGDLISAHYTGWLSDGTKFDASRDHGGAFQFPLGAGRVISGWDQGIVGMKVGEIRRLTIPPELAYGANGISGTIPPNATLIFEVELVKIN